MNRIWLKEMGRYKSGNTDLATTYTVTGLPEGMDCVIGYAGMDQWRIDWRQRTKDGEVERVVSSETLYASPDLALQAMQEKLQKF